MTDSAHDSDDHHVTYRGQVYRRIAVEPYIRDDGSETRLATWETECPECGEVFPVDAALPAVPAQPALRGPSAAGFASAQGEVNERHLH